MRNSVELIPVVDFPTVKDEESKNVPSGSVFSNYPDWKAYTDRELLKNYSRAYDPISTKLFQYELMKITNDDLLVLVKMHIGDLPMDRSCSLFGGYALVVDGQIELYPQCCGLLEEIQDWKRILEDDFAPFYLSEGHPSPLISKDGSNLEIKCDSEDQGEDFQPLTRKLIVVPLEDARRAVLDLLERLAAFSERLDTLGKLFNTDSVSRYMIWGGKDSK